MHLRLPQLHTTLALLATATAATTTTATAQIGLKLSSASPNSPSITIKSNPTVLPTTGLTVEAWMTFDETTARNYATIIRHTVGAPNVGSTPSYNFRVESPQASRILTFKVRTAAGGVRAANYNFQPGEFRNWTHVAGTYDLKEVKLFINGVEVAKNTQTGPIADQGGDLAIGSGSRASGAETWNGELDEVRLWPFARTAAEIQSTMKLALTGVPGLVSSWNLDFTPKDSSGKNDGTDYDSPTYGVNTLQLTSANIGAAAFGAGTAGCAGTPVAGVSGYATAGNAGFAATCLDGPASGGGYLWIGAARRTSALPFLGAALWVDISLPGILVPVASDANRLVHVPLPLPTGTPKSASVHLQFAFAETGCNVPLFASEGLTITTQ